MRPLFLALGAAAVAGPVLIWLGQRGISEPGARAGGTQRWKVDFGGTRGLALIGLVSSAAVFAGLLYVLVTSRAP